MDTIHTILIHMYTYAYNFQLNYTYTENVRTHETLVTEEVSDSIDHDSDEGVPKSIIGNACGKRILDYEAVNIAPPTGFSDSVDAELSSTNQKAYQKVMQKEALQHQERLILRMIPIYQSTANYKENKFHFYILGDPEANDIDHINEYTVYSGDYPHQACCCLPKKSCICC